MGKRKTTDEFISDAIKVHGNKYKYTLVDYINNKTKIKIICPKHGIFEQQPNNHLNGSICIKCNNKNKSIRQTYSINEFIIKANKKHNNIYDYSLVEYKNSKSKIIIICNKHGEYTQTPYSHLQGKGCPKCANNYKLTTDIFITKANKKHNNVYDYGLVKYINSQSKIRIICNKHGEYTQTPYSHLQGKGCPKCANNIKKTTEQFINTSKEIHKNKYEYKIVNYINAKTKIKIICPKHGVFKQRPYNHIKGEGCPVCNESKGENKIRLYLIEKNINFIQQKRFEECKNIYTLPFDFYLPDYNTCIEYDGIQHYKIIDFFGGKKGFNNIKKNDNIKTKYCIDNNIKLLRINYNQNISILLNSIKN